MHTTDVFAEVDYITGGSLVAGLSSRLILWTTGDVRKDDLKAIRVLLRFVENLTRAEAKKLYIVSLGLHRPG